MAALGGFHGPQKFVPNRHAVPDLNAKTKGAAEVWWKHFDTRKTNYLTKSEYISLSHHFKFIIYYSTFYDLQIHVSKSENQS